MSDVCSNCSSSSVSCWCEAKFVLLGQIAGYRLVAKTATLIYSLGLPPTAVSDYLDSDNRYAWCLIVELSPDAVSAKIHDEHVDYFEWNYYWRGSPKLVAEACVKFTKRFVESELVGIAQLINEVLEVLQAHYWEPKLVSSNLRELSDYLI